jgi:hypothetical protein
METKVVPKLVNPENFVSVIKKVKPVPVVPGSATVPVKVKWNLNKILLVLFVLFMIFFLYNCKYGMFKSIGTEPIPYSLAYNQSLINS